MRTEYRAEAKEKVGQTGEQGRGLGGGGEVCVCAVFLKRKFLQERLVKVAVKSIPLFLFLRKLPVNPASHSSARHTAYSLHTTRQRPSFGRK